MEGLLKTLINLISDWDKSFPTKKSANRAKLLAISILITLGRKTISAALSSIGLDQVDWSATYKFFSRTFWKPADLFRVNIVHATSLIKDDVIAIAWDDTLIKKTGKKILGASWQRDSLSPPWRVNFSWGFKFIQASILLPLYCEKVSKPCRAIPVQLERLPKHKKPRKNASKEVRDDYQKLCRQYNSSTMFVKLVRYMRNELNAIGLKKKKLLAVVDGSYINKTTFNHDVVGVSLVGRTRKNSRFFFKEKKGRQFYSKESITAEEFRKSPQKYREARIHYAGRWRNVRYKQILGVYQKFSTRKKRLRLIVVAPTPYRRNRKGKLEYRDPAYLLTDDFELSATILIQKYFDRWQIEVNFKEEKQQMSLGKQQNWSQDSISKVPAFIVATYGALLLAGVLHFSENRNPEAFGILPKWRNQDPKRPSFSSIQQVLRYEVARLTCLDLDDYRIQTNINQIAMASKA